MDRSSHLYVSDLDGTLLQRDATLSRRTRELLRRGLDRGLQFSVASARSWLSMRPILEGVPLRLPVVEVNGAYITDASTGAHLDVRSMPTGLVEELYDWLARRGVAPTVSAFDGTEDRLYPSRMLNDGIQAYLDERRAARDPRVRREADPESHLDEQVVCLTSIGPPQQIIPMAEELRRLHGEALQIFCWEEPFGGGQHWQWLTIHDATATKARGLSHVMRYADVPSERLVVFGDHVNDVSMFEMAGHAVAVANAVPELRAHADRIIGPNTEDSVARYILEHAGIPD